MILNALIFIVLVICLLIGKKVMPIILFLLTSIVWGLLFHKLWYKKDEKQK